MKRKLLRGFIALTVILMLFALASCGEKENNASGEGAGAGNNKSGDKGDAGTAQADGWYSESRLAVFGLTGLTQPAGTAVKESSDTNVKLTGMTAENYKKWVADAFALINERHGGVYEAHLGDDFQVGSFTKIPSLTAADVSTDELPSFDLIYKHGDAVVSLYILYYPVDYLSESAGSAEVRVMFMTSEWGELPFSD